MAVGVFTLDALQRFPIPALSTVTQLLTLELIVIWIFIAASYLASWIGRTLNRHTGDPVNRFAIGTWVAGTSVLGEAVLLAVPAWHLLAWALGLITAALWLWFLILAITGFWAITGDSTREHAKGRILLATVSTQSVVIVAVALFPGQIPEWSAAGVIALGCLFYVIGTGLIAARYLGQRGWRLAEDWDNTNCILHGAVSITGLAIIASAVLRAGWIIAIWLWAASMFVVVESVELARARRRVRAYGWKRGLFSYHVSQWARNFTFGMLYAFTLHLHLSLPGADGSAALAALWTFLVRYGQYVVLALLLVEIALYVSGNLRFPNRADTVTPAHLALGGHLAASMTEAGRTPSKQ
jgi:hypothetical protein